MDGLLCFVIKPPALPERFRGIWETTASFGRLLDRVVWFISADTGKVLITYCHNLAIPNVTSFDMVRFACCELLDFPGDVDYGFNATSSLVHHNSQEVTP